MRTLLLADSEFAGNEHALLSRLSIALAEAGASPVLAMPERTSAGASEPAGVLCASQVGYDARGSSFSLTGRVMQLLRALPDHIELSPARGEPGAVVHVFGRRVWKFARRLREETGTAMVFELSRAADAEALAAMLRHAVRDVPGAPLGVVSAGENILRRFQANAPGVLSALARWGVNVKEPTPAGRAPGEMVSLGVLAPGGTDHDRGVRDIIEAAGILSASRAELLVFLDSRGAAHHGVWRAARRRGVLDRLTLVSDVEQRAEHFLQTTILVVPERLGECRSILLSAMAQGCPIVARHDPDAEWLIDGTTAILADNPNCATCPLGGRAWADVIDGVLSNPARVEQVRHSAREYVLENHSPLEYAESLLGVYRALIKQGTEQERATETSGTAR
ncbi:MAG: hypothetical protein AB7G11_08125 [Phycisphaerales bacterium]